MTAIDGIPGLTVTLERTERGGWRIVGQHLGSAAPGGAEYEYALSIVVDDVPTFAAALGVDSLRSDPAEIVAAWNDQVQQIVRGGEKRWLERHHIPHGFSSRVE